MKHIFIIIFLIIQQVNVKSQTIVDTIKLKEKLGITRFYLSNNLQEINHSEITPPFSEHTEIRFEPIKIKYVLTDNNLNSDLFKEKRIYINTDSTKTITSLVFEIKNSDKIVEILTNILGNMTSNSSFKIGSISSMITCKGWVTKNMSIMLLSLNNLELIILYDGNNRNLMR